jgi:phospholipase C
MTLLDRRSFLRGAAGLGAAALGAPLGLDVLAGCSSSKNTNPPSRASLATTQAPSTTLAAAGGLPAPDQAPFDTVVVLMMENRSFDHLLGWLPGADGQQVGVRLADQMGAVHDSYRMGSDPQGCQYYDPAHDWMSMVRHLDGGKCDGFLLTQPDNDAFPISYYTGQDLPVVAALAQGHTVFDRYFCSLAGPTWPNRLYQLSAAADLDTTGVLTDGPEPGSSKIATTIFDRAQAKGVTAGYYSHPGAYMTHVFASRRYDSITYPYEKFLMDASAGTLPNVTVVDPDWSVAKVLTSQTNDFHPTSSVQLGEAFVAEVYSALAKSPQWERLVFVLNFDENGGFHDHVVPPHVPDNNVNPAPGPHPDYSQLGFRVPMHRHGPVRAGTRRDGRALRALFGPEDDGVALGPRSHDSSGPQRAEPRPRPQLPGTRRPCPAAEHRRSPRRRMQAQGGEPLRRSAAGS